MPNHVDDYAKDIVRRLEATFHCSYKYEVWNLIGVPQIALLPAVRTRPCIDVSFLTRSPITPKGLLTVYQNLFLHDRSGRYVREPCTFTNVFNVQIDNEQLFFVEKHLDDPNDDGLEITLFFDTEWRTAPRTAQAKTHWDHLNEQSP